MEPRLTLTLSSEALIGPVSILKNGKMSTLMKIEQFILETSTSDTFSMLLLPRFTESKKNFYVPVGRDNPVSVCRCRIFPELPKRNRVGLDIITSHS